MKTFRVSTLIIRTSLLALTLAAAASLARADQITFTFQPTSATQTIAATNARFGQGATGATAFTFKLSQIQDSKLSENFNETGTVTIAAIPIDIANTGTFSSSYPTSMTAFYAGETSITVTSASLCGGVCLTGIDNTGTYSAHTSTINHNGSFGGGFTLTYINPAVTELFGDGTEVLTPAELALLNPSGSADGFNSQNNAFINSAHNGVTAYALNGDLTQIVVPNFNVVPEPASLGLFGTGLLGLAGLIRSKFKKSR